MSQTYHISASSIGDGLGDSTFNLYKHECGNDEYLITTVTRQELRDGFEITVEDDVEKIYLLPILTDPTARDCVLGCGYDWAEHTLSGFVPSPSPTVTPTLTPTVTATLGSTPTPTPTTSPAEPPVSYDLDPGPHIMRRLDSTTIEIEVPGASYDRYAIANNIANYFANTSVTITTNTSSPNDESIIGQHYVFTEDEDLIVTLGPGGNVWWYNNTTQGKAYVYLTDISQLPTGVPYPTTATYLKYQTV